VTQEQLRRECAGTILTAANAESLRRVLIPIITTETQTAIKALVQISHEARRLERMLLDKAKEVVEVAIEEGKL
jgi:hypothetical protein